MKTRNRFWWALWVVTLIGFIHIEVAAQWAVFGASEAIFCTRVAGLSLRFMRRARPLLAATGTAT